MIRWLLIVLVLALPFLAITNGEAVQKADKKDIGIKLVLIPAGKFFMGLPKDKEPAEGEEPRKELSEREEAAPIDEDGHDVEITQPFYMGKYEVTQAEYEKVMGVNPSYFVKEDAKKESAKLPVEKVSWHDAKEFCDKLSKLEGKTYTLPTEAEWEYACRAGTKTTFNFGDVMAFDKANYDGTKRFPSKKGEEVKVSRNKTMPVGSFKENAFGLHDMHGNVFEWCEDWYAPFYYSVAPAKDPPGPAEGRARVIRGGSWFHPPTCCRSAYRAGVRPEFRSYNVGFRVVQRTDKAS